MPRAKKAVTTRFLKPSIKWSDFDKFVNLEERGNFLSFKAKSDTYLRKVQANPEKPPEINWEQYKKLVQDKSLVDKMQSAYEKFKVPYPSDTLTAQVDKQWEELIPKIKEYCEEQNKIICVAQKELDRINALPPFEAITMEMVYDLYPDQALKPVENPTFWPHDDEEQLGYVDPATKKSH